MGPARFHCATLLLQQKLWRAFYAAAVPRMAVLVGCGLGKQKVVSSILAKEIP